MRHPKIMALSVVLLILAVFSFVFSSTPTSHAQATSYVSDLVTDGNVVIGSVTTTINGDTVSVDYLVSDAAWCLNGTDVSITTSSTTVSDAHTGLACLSTD